MKYIYIYISIIRKNLKAFDIDVVVDGDMDGDGLCFFKTRELLLPGVIEKLEVINDGEIFSCSSFEITFGV